MVKLLSLPQKKEPDEESSGGNNIGIFFNFSNFHDFD